MLAIDLPLGLVVPDGGPRRRASPRATPARRSGASSSSPTCSRSPTGRGSRASCCSPPTCTTRRRTTTTRRARRSNDFDPFWEFVSGPLNAGAFGPNALDGTFGPEAVFVAAPPRPNVSPLEGFQFFGHVAIDALTRVMTVSLRDLDGVVRYSVELEPDQRARRS